MIKLKRKVKYLKMVIKNSKIQFVVPMLYPSLLKQKKPSQTTRLKPLIINEYRRWETYPFLATP